MKLQVREQLVSIEPALAARAAVRCQLPRFLASSPEPAASELLCGRCPEGSPQLDSADPARGRFQVSGAEVRVEIPADPVSAELALRTIFQAAVLRQGGLLVHGAGLAFQEAGALACGKSGEGKTTLARWCKQAGAEVLSDETIGLYPDGKAHGTPFRSDLDLGASPRVVPLRMLLWLSHGSAERLEPVGPAEAARLLLASTYRVSWGEVNSAELFSRAAAVVERVPAFRLTFRNHPEAGSFLARRLAAPP